MASCWAFVSNTKPFLRHPMAFVIRSPLHFLRARTTISLGMALTTRASGKTPRNGSAVEIGEAIQCGCCGSSGVIHRIKLVALSCGLFSQEDRKDGVDYSDAFRPSWIWLWLVDLGMVTLPADW